MSAVCHHGGAGTTAAGLRAGKPNIIVPFFGDQFFWGNVVEKMGAGPRPTPGKDLTAETLIEAFQVAHEPRTRAAAERIKRAILAENGCEEAVRAFHAHLPVSRMRSDLESTFAACYDLNEYDLRISRPVAQVLITAGRITPSQLSMHVTQEWMSMYDNRVRMPFHGLVKHAHKAIVAMVSDTFRGVKCVVHLETWTDVVRSCVEGFATGLVKGLGHVCIGCVSLYAELTDVLECLPAFYDPYT